jgi:hypothetical protein
LLLNAVSNSQSGPKQGYGIRASSDFIGKPVMLPFYQYTHGCYDCISLPSHPRDRNWSSTHRIKGTGRKVLACDEVLWPESDGEQCSVVGRPSNWYVLPRISLKPLQYECEA